MKVLDNHKLRVVELIDKGYSNSLITSLIYNEYGIKLSIKDIESKKDPSYRNAVKEKAKYEIEVKEKAIINALRQNKCSPKSSKDIAFHINKNEDIKISKREVNRILYHSLRSKVYYDRRTFQYYLKEETVGRNRNIEKKELKINNFFNFTNNALENFQSYFKGKYFTVETGDSSIDYLIKTVVKDNRITECEEIFLKQKAKELGLSLDLIEAAKTSMFSNNPYLDNIIEIILDDGQITREELAFLKEKSNENHFTEKIVSTRFWTTAFTLHFNKIRAQNKLEDFIKTLHVCIELDLPKLQNSDWLFNHLCIWRHDNFPDIVRYATSKVIDELEIFITQKYHRTSEISLPLILSKIKLPEIDEECRNQDSLSGGFVDNTRIFEILELEKRRIGTPDADLFAENIRYRLEHRKWD